MKLTDKCYAVLGLGCYPPWVVNAGFICGSGKTLVVDSSSAYLSAQTIYDYAKAVNPNNELLLINTEKHLDHIGGNCLFEEKGIPIFGHELNKRLPQDLESNINYFNDCILEEERKSAREEKIFYQNTKLVNPSFKVADGQIFDIGDAEAKILFTPGHTETNISIFIPSEKVIYVGDAVVQGYLPNILNSDLDGWKQWLNSLDIISSLDIYWLVPGHGNALSGNGIRVEIERIRKILNRAIETGDPKYAVS